MSEDANLTKGSFFEDFDIFVENGEIADNITGLLEKYKSANLQFSDEDIRELFKKFPENSLAMADAMSILAMCDENARLSDDTLSWGVAALKRGTVTIVRVNDILAMQQNPDNSEAPLLDDNSQENLI